jgi:hypothetical protein
MKRNYEPGFGYVELNPDLNDFYDPETGEEIYIPSNYPFDIPKVYIEGGLGECVDRNSIITVKDNLVTRYTHFDNCGSEFYVVEYNLDTLEKKEYNFKLNSSSRISLWDCFSLLDYIDPNLIKKINNKDEIPSPSN